MGRDVTTMAVLQPATTPGGQVAGSSQDGNTYTLDGANITDDMSGNVTSYQTNFVGLGRKPRQRRSFGRDSNPHREH